MIETLLACIAASGAKLPVAFRSAGTIYGDVDDGAGGFNLSPGAPAGKAVADWLVLHMAMNTGAGVTVASLDVPSGWTDLGQVTDGTTRRASRLAGRWADGSGSDTPNVTGSASGTGITNCMAARIYAFSGGAGSGDPRNGASATSRASSTTMTQEPFTTTVPDCLGAHFLAIHSFSGATASFTGEANANLVESATGNTTAGADLTLQLQTGLVTVAAAVSGGTFTIGAANIHSTHAFGIKNT